MVLAFQGLAFQTRERLPVLAWQKWWWTRNKQVVGSWQLWCKRHPGWGAVSGDGLQTGPGLGKLCGEGGCWIWSCVGLMGHTQWPSSNATSRARVEPLSHTKLKCASGHRSALHPMACAHFPWCRGCLLQPELLPGECCLVPLCQIASSSSPSNIHTCSMSVLDEQLSWKLCSGQLCYVGCEEELMLNWWVQEFRSWGWSSLNMGGFLLCHLNKPLSPIPQAAVDIATLFLREGFKICWWERTR